MAKASDSWSTLTETSAGMEAEIIAARIRAAGIPVRVNGSSVTGIFGPGFQGATPLGFRVEVPQRHLSAARDILN
jgi:hypothetical protein